MNKEKEILMLKEENKKLTLNNEKENKNILSLLNKEN